MHSIFNSPLKRRGGKWNRKIYYKFIASFKDLGDPIREYKFVLIDSIIGNLWLRDDFDFGNSSDVSPVFYGARKIAIEGRDGRTLMKIFWPVS